MKNRFIKTILKLRPKNEDNIIQVTSFIGLEKIINQAKDEIYKYDRDARKDAENNLPDPNLSTYGETESRIKSQFLNIHQNLERKCGPLLLKYEEQLKSIEQKKNEFAANREKVIDHICKPIENIMIRKLEDLRAGIEEDLISINRSRDSRLRELRKLETELNDTETKLGYRPHHMAILKQIAYTIFIVLAAVCDVEVSYLNIEKLGNVPMAGSVLIASITSICLAVSAHLLGQFLKIHNVKGIIGAACSGLLFLTVVAFLGIHSNALLMIFVTLAIFVLITVISYYNTPRFPHLVKKYHKDRFAISAKEKELAGIEKKIAKYRSKARKKEMAIIAEKEDAIEEKINEYTEYLTEQYNIVVQDLQILKKEWAIYAQMVDSFYKQTIHRYRSINEDERKNKNLPLVAYWKLPHSVTSLNLSSESEEEPLVIPQLNSGEAKNDSSNWLKVIQLFIGLTFITSCEVVQPNDAPRARVMTLVDITDSLSLDTEATANMMFQHIGGDTNQIMESSAFVHVKCLNDQLTNRVFFAHIDKSKGALVEVTKKRLEQQKEFRNDLQDALSKIQFQGALSNSKLYRPICLALKELADSEEDIKHCFIFSNLLENTKYLSLYNYLKNPQQLLVESDEIKASLEKQCSLPNLEGIEIFVIHQPDKATDELFDVAKEFWQAYFEEKGAKVQFLTGV